jgi:hypothetical protein
VRPAPILAAVLLAFTLASCGRGEPDRVVASDYDSFWLWAGVRPPRELSRAKSVYVLDGEIEGAPVRWKPLRAGAPRTRGPDLWLVVRTDTMDWPKGTAEALARRADGWAHGGTRVVGIQIDFDARTRHLEDYAAALERFRNNLPRRYKLSITGLMDWSANGDPRSLRRLKGIVDEVVIQTYQGRSTIWGYEGYFQRMRGFPIPFKVGLVEDGRWIEPTALRAEPNFRGYVLFLLPKRR